MMVKEENNRASIFRSKCQMLITHKGFHFETPDAVLLSTMSYH